jgi:hypothetical protein
VRGEAARLGQAVRVDGWCTHATGRTQMRAPVRESTSLDTKDGSLVACACAGHHLCCVE